jgi:hypothetical protein
MPPPSSYAMTGQRPGVLADATEAFPRRTSHCPRTPPKEDKIVLSYCFAWTPLVILMTVVLLSLPWLGLIALFVFSLLVLALLATLAWTVIWVPRTLSRPYVTAGESAIARVGARPRPRPCHWTPRVFGRPDRRR